MFSQNHQFYDERISFSDNIVSITLRPSHFLHLFLQCYLNDSEIMVNLLSCNSLLCDIMGLETRAGYTLKC